MLELRKELKQPIEFRQMDRKIPVSLEPELYKSKLVAFELEAKLQNIGNEKPLIDTKVLFSQDISALKEPFKKKLHEAASLFYWATVKDTGNEWIPIPLSPVEVRDNQKQAKVMVELYPINRLADIYAKDGSIPASRKIYELMDHIFVDGLPHFLEDYRKLYTPILPEIFVKTKDLDAGEKHWEEYFENLIYGYTDDSIIAGHFMGIMQKMFMDSHTLIKAAFNRAFKKPTALPWEKESNKTQQKELAKKILVHMLEDPQKRYGYMSTHRFGHAVDVQSNYKYLEKLKTAIKKGKFGLATYDEYNKKPDPVTGLIKASHLHIGLGN